MVFQRDRHSQEVVSNMGKKTQLGVCKIYNLDLIRDVHDRILT